MLKAQLGVAAISGGFGAALGAHSRDSARTYGKSDLSTRSPSPKLCCANQTYPRPISTT